MLGLALLGTFLTLAVFAPLIAPYDPRVKSGEPFEPPSGRHLLGTNDIGEDILSELIHGARISLLIGSTVAVIAVLLGTLVGIVSGYYGGAVDSGLMRLVDVILVLPSLPLLILFAAFLGPSFLNLILVMSILMWTRPARVIRSQVLSTRALGYVEAAESLGGSIAHTLRHHVMPRVLPLALAQFILVASIAILIEASLSFLGLGDPLAKSWGTMLYYANVRGAFLTGAWVWWIIPPGLAIAATVLGFAFTGYALEELANPRLKR